MLERWQSKSDKQRAGVWLGDGLHHVTAVHLQQRLPEDHQACRQGQEAESLHLHLPHQAQRHVHADQAPTEEQLVYLTPQDREESVSAVGSLIEGRRREQHWEEPEGRRIRFRRAALRRGHLLRLGAGAEQDQCGTRRWSPCEPRVCYQSELRSKRLSPSNRGLAVRVLQAIHAVQDKPEEHRDGRSAEQAGRREG